jgi:hypothetical protein
VWQLGGVLGFYVSFGPKFGGQWAENITPKLATDDPTQLLIYNDGRFNAKAKLL